MIKQSEPTFFDVDKAINALKNNDNETLQKLGKFVKRGANEEEKNESLYRAQSIRLRR